MNTTPKSNPLLEIALTLVIPSLILMKLSTPEQLGTTNALILALSFPLGWGIFDWIRNRKINLFAALGLVSVLLTGGIGLLELDTQWLAVKEAAIPAILGIAVIGSTYTKYPLIRTVLFNQRLLHVEKIQEQLAIRGTQREFDQRLQTANWLFGGTFAFSATMNYFLATYIVTSPSGTAAFNEELGQLTLMSYPMIAIPSMLMMLAVFYYLARSIRSLAGLTLTEVMHGAE
ncbi:MAG TPA: VC0807 family protein [Candidatus Thiothrix moscowensis]|uniref:VC0807 family protein n=1 Tax=unclassified Thiothrix TaxID=2636184 RepID=UPI0025FBC287|nr:MULTISPECIES: VC0807 family protein [unclassified Thiothrix]HRJ53884.1 VC0807 family protein [Candidatus Thiothrix moscowensis]HRJ93966.1 VC0807 family protein [Candidatus Thiothrix moscowensis]